MSQDSVPATIKGIYIHPNQKVPVVFLADESGNEVIPMFIGFLEAQAIVLAWRKLPAPRPLTIDLLRSIVTEDLKAVIEKVEIRDVRNGVFLASIMLRNKDGVLISRDARPSDAIPLALLADVPIEIGKNVFQRSEFERENARALLEYLELEAKDSERALYDLEG